MVMIGVYMVVFSENEERVKTQRRQMIYVLVGFVFLNVPGVVYDILTPSSASGQLIRTDSWSLTSVFWYTAKLPGLVGDLL